ncbi:MAG TPA: nitrogen fixation protein NifZ [Motiliproteus sp.]
MIHKYDYGQAVRVIRTLRDDGTYPGKQRGDLLVQRGRTGYVVDVGTFLQDQIIYRVHFIDAGVQVGCREEELIPAEAPWVESRFEFRQPVQAARDLAVNGEVLVVRGDQGQVLKVLRQPEQEVRYQVRFPGRTLEVREQALEAWSE